MAVWPKKDRSAKCPRDLCRVKLPVERAAADVEFHDRRCPKLALRRCVSIRFRTSVRLLDDARTAECAKPAAGLRLRTFVGNNNMMRTFLQAAVAKRAIPTCPCAHLGYSCFRYSAET